MPSHVRPAASATPRLAIWAVIAAALLLSACEQLGIESPEKIAAAKDADGRAIGGACRHAGRAIEDCYTLYKKADRAAVFAGWRDMNDYMRENKIDVVAPVLAGQPQAPAPAAATDDAADTREPAKKVAKAGAH